MNKVLLRRRDIILSPGDNRVQGLKMMANVLSCDAAGTTATTRRQALAALLPVAEVHLRHRLESAELKDVALSAAAAVVAQPTSLEEEDPVVPVFRGPLLAYLTAKQDSSAGDNGDPK